MPKPHGAENVSLLRNKDGSHRRLGRMREAGHQFLDRMVNQGLREGRTVSGIAVVVAFSREHNKTPAIFEWTGESCFEMVAALDEAAFKLKLDLWLGEERSQEEDPTG